jgi:hypothetical protein
VEINDQWPLTIAFQSQTPLHQGVKWSEDGSAIAFSSTARDGTHFDVWTCSLSSITSGTPDRKLVMSNEVPGYFLPQAYSKSHILVQRYVSVSDSTLLLIPSSGGDARTIAPSSLSMPAAICCGRLWHSKGVLVGVVYASNEGSEFMTLRYYDLKEGKEKEIVGEKDVKWDVEVGTVQN